jgi:hypothetical protein
MRFLSIVFMLLIALNVQSQTSFNHPVSGAQSFTLAPGIYNYYDNGGPNGNYSDNIDLSSITFSPQQGHRIRITYLQFDVEQNGFSGGCYDYLSLGWLPDCGDLYLSTEYCEVAIGSGQSFCNSESVTFSFFSDGSVTLPGWHIRIEVLRKTPANIVCTDFPCFPDFEVISCSGGGNPTVIDTLIGIDRVEKVFSCSGFVPGFPCNGTIDYYPGCDNIYYPGKEAVYYLTLSETKTLFLSCECLKEVFAVREGGCACQKFVKDGNEFTLSNVAPGNYYIIAELECNTDPCICDFVFECSNPGPGVLDCANAVPIDCGATIFSSNAPANGGVNNVNSYCSPSAGSGWTGRERVYFFQADFNGLVYISLTSLFADLDLFVLNGCERTSCRAISDNPGASSESIQLNVKKGESFYIVIDGWNFAQSSYLLEIQCEKEDECVECGKCFTYSLVNKGLNTDVVLRSKYNDCTIPNFPTAAHSFRWTIDGLQASTAQNPTLSVPTHKQVTICQEVRLNNNVIFSCCWVVNAAPGCQAPPVAHWTLTSPPLNTTATFNASASKGAGRFFWDFGDGSPLLSTDMNPVATKTYSPSQPQRAACVYVQNAWGISQYCKTLAPGAFECASSPSPRFDYTITGNTVSITSDNPSGVIKEWEIDFGNGVTNSGTNWTTQGLTYSNAGTYEVCIRFRVEFGQSLGVPCSFTGCVYFTVKVGCCVNVQENCNNLRFRFLNANNGLLYELTRSTTLIQQVVGWEIDDVPVPNSAQNTLQFLFPAAGVYKICFIYLDPATGCFIKCCRLISIGNPFDCGNVFFLFEAGKGYQFFTEANGSDFVWTNDDTGEIIGQGKISNFLPVPGPGNCVEVNISVRYFDPTCNCWRLCCIRVFLCNPELCDQEIQVITNPGPGGSTALCVKDTYTQVRWTCLSTNQVIGTGTCVNITNLTCQVYCVQYYDPVAKRFQVCCIDRTTGLEDPASLLKVDILPNPFRDHLTVTAEFRELLGASLELLDAQGRQVSTAASGQELSLRHSWNLDTGHLAQGVYILRILTSDGGIIRKVVKND